MYPDLLLLNRFWIVLLCLQPLLATAMALPDTEIKGLVQGGYINANEHDIWMRTWQEGGTGVTRFDDWNEDIVLSQAILENQLSLLDDLTLNVTANYYPDGEQRWGFTESYLEYSPLSSGWRFRSKLGAFYPSLSKENTDIGWNSPYTYQYSALNSWIAEEIRIFGVELSWLRPGPRFHSPWSYDLRLGLFNNNDGTGSLLAWRGWAMHDRQTRIGEKVVFAQYPSFMMGSLATQPNFVRPFKETDEKPGGYAGLHLNYLNQHEIRGYYYHNQADPTKVESNGQYAWETQFYSLSWFANLHPIHVLVQWLQGETVMGNTIVDNDFYAAYILISMPLDFLDKPDHRLSVRHDRFKVIDKDHYSIDYNDSEGQAWTVSWRYQFAEKHQLGIEWLQIDSRNKNRRLWGWDERKQQNQFQINFQYFFKKNYISETK